MFVWSKKIVVMKKLYTLPHTWKHGAMSWLLANIMGSLLVGVRLFFKGDRNFVLAPFIGFFAAGISLPITPLSVLLLHKVLQLPSKHDRICLALLTVTGLFAVVIGLVIYINQEFNFPASALVELLLPFYIGALVATGLKYQKWLF